MATKQSLLSYLKERKGSWVSGEVLSNKLAVSRAAICKHTQKLREDGHVIEASTKKGYLFRGASDRLLADEIREGLRTNVFGKKEIVYFGEIDSTNTKAKDLAADGAPEGVIVVAEKQTCGRGRKGRTWFSPSCDGIYVSLILRPAIPPSEAPRITLMTAVAVADALLSLIQLPLTIKWPNDILVRGKKMAGILTEISTEMDSVDYVVVGLGLNVNTSPESFPKGMKEKATSILIESGKWFPRIELIRTYLQYFEMYYEKLRRGMFDVIMRRWKGLTNLMGQHVVVEVIGEKYFGKVIDVDSNGALIIRDNHGRSHRIFSGDLNFLEP